MKLKNIVILGPRGNISSAIIKELLEDGHKFNVTAITHPTSTYSSSGPTITIEIADHHSLSSFIAASTGQDAVVNCVTGSATQYEAMKLVIDAAITASVKLYFSNEFIRRRMPELIVWGKVRIREWLEEEGAKGEGGELRGMKWSSLNGGPFFDILLMKGPAGINIPNKLARIYSTGNNPLCWTPSPPSPLAAANMRYSPSPILDRPIYINTVPRLTQSLLITTVESILAKRFTIEYIDVAEIHKNARLALDRGEMGKAMKGLTISNQSFRGDSGNDLSGLVENETVGVEEAVKQAVGIWGMNGRVKERMFREEACEVWTGERSSEKENNTNPVKKLGSGADDVRCV